MHTASKIVRTIALALMFAGGAGIVFSAVVLVKAATASGVPVSEAATANAPIFIAFSRVLVGCAAALAAAELVDFGVNKNKSRLVYARYILGLVAIGTALAFTFGVVAQMEVLMPTLKTSTADHEQFMKLHEVSRMIFGTTILSALAALLLPLFERPAAQVGDASETKVTVTA